MKQRVLHLLKIEANEWRKVLLMALYLFLVVTIFIAGRITRDTLFLQAFDHKVLAYMYLTVAIVLPFPAYFYSRIADRFRRDRILLVTCTAIGLALLLLYLLLSLVQESWVLIVFYNFIEIMGAFLIIQFWTFASDLFSSRQAKRLFPLISGGGIIAGIVSGIGTSQLTALFSSQSILLFMVLLLLPCAAIIYYMGQLEKNKLQNIIFNKKKVSIKKHPKKSHSTQKSKVQLDEPDEQHKYNTPRTTILKKVLSKELFTAFQSKHLQVIAAMTILTFITVPLIDYVFKVEVKDFFAGQQDASQQMSNFFGTFYSMTGILAALIQFAFTGRIIERFGISIGLLVLPFSLFLGTFSTLVSSLFLEHFKRFFFAVFAKSAENTFRYSIYDASLQILYTPISGHIRGRVKTFIDGMLKPWAVGFAGLLITVSINFLGLSLSFLNGVATFMIVLWVISILKIRKEYMNQLLSSLKEKRLDLSQTHSFSLDSIDMAHLLKQLKSNNPQIILNALSLLKTQKHQDFSANIIHLLKHHDPRIPIEVLQILAYSNSIRFIENIHQCLKSDAKEIHAHAVKALCEIAGQNAIRFIKPYIKNNNAQLRGASIAGLIKHGGLEGVVLAADSLKSMQYDRNADMRLCAAQVFADIKVQNFYRPILKLLHDPNAQVRIEAIRAAGEMKSLELLPSLIYNLADNKSSRYTSQALANYGEGILATLNKVLIHHPEDINIRREIPKIMEMIGGEKSFNLLLNALNVRDLKLQTNITRSAVVLRQKLILEVDRRMIKKLLMIEFRKAYEHAQAIYDIEHFMNAQTKKQQISHFLITVVNERQLLRRTQIFLLLKLIYPVETLELIERNLLSKKERIRANAFEALENLLDKEEKHLLIALIDSEKKKQVRQKANEYFSQKSRSFEEWQQRFLASSDPWLIIAAQQSFAEYKPSMITSIVLKNLKHGSYLVRENALQVGKNIFTKEDFKLIAQKLTHDRHINVRRYAQHLLDSGDFNA